MPRKKQVSKKALAAQRRKSKLLNATGSTASSSSSASQTHKKDRQTKSMGSSWADQDENVFPLNSPEDAKPRRRKICAIPGSSDDDDGDVATKGAASDSDDIDDTQSQSTAILITVEFVAKQTDPFDSRQLQWLSSKLRSHLLSVIALDCCFVP